MSRRGNNQGTVTFDTSKQRFRARLGPRSKLFATRTEADNQLRDWLNEREEGRSLVRNKQTLRDYLVAWNDRRYARGAIAVTTTQVYDSYIKKHIGTHAIGSRSLDAADWPAAIETFLDDKLAEGMATASVRQMHTILRKALGDARRANLIGFNPATREYVEGVKVHDQPARVIRRGDEQRLADQFRGHRYEHLFMFLLATGCRLGEARGLRWKDFDGTPLVDLQQGSVLLGLNTIISLKKQYRVKKGRNWDWKRLSKTGQAVLVFLPEQGLDALKAQEHRIKLLKMAALRWHDNDLVFPAEDGYPFDASNVWHTLQRLCKKAGVPPLPVHATRHTSATNDLRAGTDRRVVMAKHGWSQEVMLKRYQHVDEELLREAARASAKYLPRIQTDAATG